MYKFFSTIMGLLLSFNVAAGTIQRLTINNEVVEKTVTRITFEGDNVVLQFSNDTSMETDMSGVVLNFLLPQSIKSVESFKLAQTIGNVLNVKGLAKDTEIRVLDAAGRQMISTKKTSIDVSHLPQGIYLLQVGNQVVKFNKK